jgi:hypothetical protein
MTYLILGYAFATLMLGGFLALSLLLTGVEPVRRRLLRAPSRSEAARRRGSAP